VLGSAGVVLVSLVIGLIAYALSLQLTRLFASSPRWAWTVGATDFNLRKFIGGLTGTKQSMAPAEQGLSNA
jgi:hypothetical protein